jgi:heme/copper-type cytochrome/quinol oxidase subunit 2
MVSLPWTILWLAAGISVVVCGLLAASLIKAQRNSARQADPDQNYQNSPILEIIWTFIPVGLLLLILVLTFEAMK